MKRGLLLLLASLVLAAPAQAAGREVEVVVALDAPPLAYAVERSRVLSSAAKQRRLDLRTPMASSYLRSLAASQRSLEARLTARIPRAEVRRRYRIVLNGLSVVVPADRVRELERLTGVAQVYPSIRYSSRLDRSPQQIGVPQLWGSSLETAGAGVKIGIIDDGVDQTHPFFSPTGFALPEGFPKGNAAFTTAKVIVARAFTPRTPTWRHASKPFDPELSAHATHVAGIAAGNVGVYPGAARGTISGVAPRAYLGNYKALTIPTASGVGLDGNSPEIAAAIEAAVADGMDVINLSLGEPEIEPKRDLVVAALNAAAAAGVVPAVAAGNDFGDFGAGSVGSPGSAANAITVGAVTTTRSAEADRVAGFSSGGPTPISLRLKPDVAAPGVGIVSAVPAHEGTWETSSGTSMAAPHVAGAAAVLRQRHPDWTVAQLKSALVLTGAPLPAPPQRVGGGRIDVARADTPLLFASPTSLSFGLLPRRASVTATVDLADAGGGAGEWSVAADRIDGVAVTTPATVTVPGTLEVAAAVSTAANEGDFAGYIVLARGEDRRRIPFWLGVTVPSLGAGTVLSRPGVYRSTTAGRPARVESYRYPADPSGAGVNSLLAGPERVYRVRLTRTVANFGVVILSRARGVRVEPRIVSAGDESRQVGYTSLPLNLNPYLDDFLMPRLVSGAVRPAPGNYRIVFDSATPAGAGAFTFRYWVNDTAPPKLRLLTRRPLRLGSLEIAATDAGSGVDPLSIRAAVDGRAVRARLRGNRVFIPLGGIGRGRHRLVLQVSDYQETRNQENVPRILPNTARLSAVFTIR